MDTFKKNKSKVLITLIALLLLFITTFAFVGCSDLKEITQDEFYAKLDAGEIAGVNFYGETVYVVCVGETDGETTQKLANFPKEYDFYIKVSSTYEIESIQNTVEQYNLDNQANIVISNEPAQEDEPEENQ